MGYKYRKGETPDHVDSSESNAKNSHIASDTTKVLPDSSDFLTKQGRALEKEREKGGKISLKDWTGSGGSKSDYNGYGGEFDDNEMKAFNKKATSYDKSMHDDIDRAELRTNLSVIKNAARQKSDNTRVSPKKK